MNENGTEHIKVSFVFLWGCCFIFLLTADFSKLIMALMCGFLGVDKSGKRR